VVDNCRRADNPVVAGKAALETQPGGTAGEPDSIHLRIASFSSFVKEPAFAYSGGISSSWASFQSFDSSGLNGTTRCDKVTGSNLLSPTLANPNLLKLFLLPRTLGRTPPKPSSTVATWQGPLEDRPDLPSGLRTHFGKTFAAVLRNRSRAAHWSPPVHCTMNTATIPVLGSTDRSVPYAPSWPNMPLRRW
jgi:hypothetical protein